MITGGIDLSVTSIIALTSVVGARVLVEQSMPTALGVAAMLGLGLAIGAVNGGVITMLRLPAFIVTLASMMFLSGFAVWFTQSKKHLRLARCLPCTWAAVAGHPGGYGDARGRHPLSASLHGVRTLALRKRTERDRRPHLGSSRAPDHLGGICGFRILCGTSVRDPDGAAGNELASARA